MGYVTQTWLAVSTDAAATVSGGYWYHRQRQAPAPQARDPAFQDQLMDRLAALTGVALFSVVVASSQIPRKTRPQGSRPNNAAMHNTWLCTAATAASSHT